VREGAQGLGRAAELAEAGRRLRRTIEESFPLAPADVLDLLADLRRRGLQIHVLESAALRSLRAALR